MIIHQILIDAEVRLVENFLVDKFIQFTVILNGSDGLVTAGRLVQFADNKTVQGKSSYEHFLKDSFSQKDR